MKELSEDGYQQVKKWSEKNVKRNLVKLKKKKPLVQQSKHFKAGKVTL